MLQQIPGALTAVHRGFIQATSLAFAKLSLNSLPWAKLALQTGGYCMQSQILIAVVGLPWLQPFPLLQRLGPG